VHRRRHRRRTPGGEMDPGDGVAVTLERRPKNGVSRHF
jgi:hypothetical protein